MKLAILLTAVILGAMTVQADTVVNVTLEPVSFMFGVSQASICFTCAASFTETVSATYTWDATTDTVTNYDVTADTTDILTNYDVAVYGTPQFTYSPFTMAFAGPGNVSFSTGSSAYNEDFSYPPVPGTYAVDIFLGCPFGACSGAVFPQPGTAVVSDMPEPSTLALLLTGIVLLSGQLLISRITGRMLA